MSDKTVALIHLDHLAYNFNEIRNKISPSSLIPVVKADAYGHGAVQVAKRLVKEGAVMFAVAQFKEAMELRESGISQPILIFGRLFPDEIPVAAQQDFVMSVFGTADIKWIEKARINKPVRVHVNVETGMGRVGLLIDQEPAFFNELAACNTISWEGIYSHFATSDEKDKAYAFSQLARFKDIIKTARQKSIHPLLVHMANSGAILDMPESYFDACRAGIMLYGHYPSSETSESIRLKQVMALKTYVAHVRRLPKGHNVSYARRWTTKRETGLAVLPVGYADGLRRGLTNTGQVLIRNKRYPMVGTVTMDQIMVDVGDDRIEPGDPVLIWGDSNQGTLQVLDVAESIGTIPYELTCGLTTRVGRVYV